MAVIFQQRQWAITAMALGLVAMCVAAVPLTIVVIARAASERLSQDVPIFATRTDLVVLHVTVTDRRGRNVEPLAQNAFTVLEDGQRQKMALFSNQDAPVTVGLLVDSSGSMQHNRDIVAAAAATFVDTSHPADETFALAFNEEVRSALPAEAPFARDALALRDALLHMIAPRGRTALYDAVAAGLDVLATGHHERKALVVVSDGGDNASRATFKEILARAQSSSVVIYTVGLPDPIGDEGDPKRLKQFAEATGGQAFVPRDVSQVLGILRQVALDIRLAYTVAYVPTNVAHDGKFRHIQIDVRAPDGRRLTAHTRAGYVAAPLRRSQE